ncbi:SPOR domain-containing protein [Balneolaceae bacterium ANBcel3]|nr:SPOR domain-containing protein [Balneolaceae bacterium ANBcel3]
MILSSLFHTLISKPGSYLRRNRVLFIWVLLLLVASCSTTEPLKDEEMEEHLREKLEEFADLSDELEEMAQFEEEFDEELARALTQRAEEIMEELPELSIDLQHYRSRFRDQHHLAYNYIPDSLLEQPAEESRHQRPDNRGFRIQLISTRDARYADEMRADFQEWIRAVTSPPHAHAYIEFQQPFYRVQIGDFRDREAALDFTDFIRLRYPDAWVVHSQIHPGRVMD